MAKDKYSIKSGDILVFPIKPDKDKFSIWDIGWEAYEKGGDQKKVATVTFLGEPDCGAVELSVTVEEGFKLHSYAKDAVRTMMDWALNQKDIYEVKCSAPVDDEVVTDAIQRAGFVFRSRDKEREYYSVDKQRTAWTALYLIIGFVAGLIMGITIGHMLVGLIIGIVIGLSIGGIMDGKAMAERANVTKHEYIAHFKRAKMEKKKKNVEENKEDEQEE